MRDAFGGAFMIRIFLIFILVYILFTAVAVNYARAFKVKDLVISYLEENEISDLNMSSEEQSKMENYFETVIGNQYHYYSNLSSGCPQNADNDNQCYYSERGIKIVRVKPSPNETNRLGVYYKVSTYFGYNIGFLRLFKAADNSEVDNTSDLGVWEIKGETRLIIKE